MALSGAVSGIRLESSFAVSSALNGFASNARVSSLHHTIKQYSNRHRRARFGLLGVAVGLAVILSAIYDAPQDVHHNTPLEEHSAQPPLSVPYAVMAARYAATHGAHPSATACSSFDVERGALTCLGDFGQGGASEAPLPSGNRNADDIGGASGGPPGDDSPHPDLPSDLPSDETGSGKGPSSQASDRSFRGSGGSPPPPPPPSYTTSGAADFIAAHKDMFLLGILVFLCWLSAYLAPKTLSNREGSVVPIKPTMRPSNTDFTDLLWVDKNSSGQLYLVSLMDLATPVNSKRTEAANPLIVDIVSPNNDNGAKRIIKELLSSTVLPSVFSATCSSELARAPVPFNDQAEAIVSTSLVEVSSSKDLLVLPVPVFAPVSAPVCSHKDQQNPLKSFKRIHLSILVAILACLMQVVKYVEAKVAAYSELRSLTQVQQAAEVLTAMPYDKVWIESSGCGGAVDAIHCSPSLPNILDTTDASFELQGGPVASASDSTASNPAATLSTTASAVVPLAAAGLQSIPVYVSRRDPRLRRRGASAKAHLLGAAKKTMA